MSYHINPPNVEDLEGCRRTWVELAVESGQALPEEVLELLLPTGAVTNTIATKLELSSDGRVESLDLRRHLEWLLEKLESLPTALARIKTDSRFVSHVRCVWWSNDSTGGPVLWPEQMERLAALGLECHFDVKFFEPIE